MRSRKAAVIGLVVLLGAAVIAVAAYGRRDGARQGAGLQQTITALQLPPESDLIPVEIRDEKAEFNSPSEVGGLSFTIKNNTNKNIEALTVIYSLIYVSQKDGKEYSDPNYLTINSLVHPDVTQAHDMKPIAPGEERPVVKDGVMGYENALLKGLEIKIDYVEFEDKSTAGADTAGSRIINTMREGAAEYKSWLVQQYKKSGDSLNAVVPILQSRDIPSELNFNDMYLKEGARIYRKHMLDVYKMHGADELRKYLSR